MSTAPGAWPPIGEGAPYSPSPSPSRPVPPEPRPAEGDWYPELWADLGDERDRRYNR